MGVRRFGSQPRNARKEGTKFIKAQVIEAEWLAAHDEPMSENKLSKEVGVTRRTIGRWREDHEYRASLPTLIECEKMILEMRRRAM